MAVTLSKLFMRTISQNPNENQTGVSLWTLEDVEKAQAKQREQALLQGQQQGQQGDDDMDEDEYGDGGMDDGMLMELDME